ncbi:T9SS type A sorting domain-containing protein [Flavobacterium sp. KBS0721]|uniref:T9SS type A sorting domain-containing protein n=1 Tax=Flavobacterium sp. KBS0721 TaxID=1179672 RepID=UPI00098EB25E|nr:T9SS type A sorting domain-containing protein [Flavobacterium sp. KBS0721]QDW22995.1 T9SS type A sorting domain-containing protein [Flavobacterium sp. KBS0721]
MITLKNYILYLFLFQFTLYSQVTVKTNELKADNKSITDNTIAFNSNPTINVSLNVHLETSNGSVDNTFGNLYVYYKKNETDIPMQVGFHSVTFYLKTYYTSDILFNTVTLHKNEFYNTGGILYAEYKNNKNQTYQSTKIAITGGSLATAPPTPTNQKIVTQNLKYSEDLPIINSKIFVPNYSSTSFDLEIYRSQSDGQTTAINIYAYEEFGKKEILLKSVGIGGFFDSYFLIKNIKINYDALDFTKYTCKIRIEIRDYSKDLSTYKSNIDILSQNTQPISIILAKTIYDNVIEGNQTLNIGEIPKPFTYQSPYIDYTIRDPKYRVSRAVYDHRPITIFKWQTKTENSNWTDIINQTSIGYNPNIIFKENVYYRRIAFYDEQFNVSNIISITRNLLNSSNKSEINIYPNPITNYFNIDGAVKINDIAIYDSFGQKINVVKQQKSTNLIEINTTNLQSGIFILKIDNTTFSKTLIKN